MTKDKDPKYNQLREKWGDLLFEIGWVYDCVFDWFFVKHPLLTMLIGTVLGTILGRLLANAIM